MRFLFFFYYLKAGSSSGFLLRFFFDSVAPSMFHALALPTSIPLYSSRQCTGVLFSCAFFVCSVWCFSFPFDATATWYGMARYGTTFARSIFLHTSFFLAGVRFLTYTSNI